MLELPELMGVTGLRVPATLSYRHLAVRFVSAMCTMAFGPVAGELDEEFDVVSAFGEAFNNIVVHGYRDMAPGRVQIEVGWDDEKVVVTLIDDGRTFDPASVALPDLDTLPENGMGLFIMNRCMDEVQYIPGPPNVLRLVKQRRQREGILPTAPIGGDACSDLSISVTACPWPGDFLGDEATDRKSWMDALAVARDSGVEQISASLEDGAIRNAKPRRMKVIGEDDWTGEASRRP